MIDAIYLMPLDAAADILESLNDIRSEIMPVQIVAISFDSCEDAVHFELRWPALFITEGLCLASSDSALKDWLLESCPNARPQECVRVVFQSNEDKVRFEQAHCERTDCEETF